MMPLLSMTAPPNLPEEDIRSKAAKLIHQLVDIDFNNMHYMNTYIPTICALVHFVKDNFSNRLTEAECRTVPFDELLDMLPPVVMSAFVEYQWLIEKVFRPSQVVEDRPDAVQFRGRDTPHTLLFQVIHATIGHDKLQSSDLLNQIEFCRLGYLECDRIMGRTAKFSLLLSMRRSSFAIHLINDWITYITQRIHVQC